MTSLTPKPSQVEAWDRLPSDWHNDERMDALFCLFKERDLNPVHYDAKMKFWSETILAFCEDHGLLQIDIPTLVSRFRRKGKTPKCLDKIFEELIKQNRLMTTTDYANTQQSSWISWSMNKLASPLTGWLAGRTPVDQDVFVVKELVDVNIAESSLLCTTYPTDLFVFRKKLCKCWSPYSHMSTFRRSIAWFLTDHSLIPVVDVD